MFSRELEAEPGPKQWRRGALGLDSSPAWHPAGRLHPASHSCHPARAFHPRRDVFLAAGSTCSPSCHIAPAPVGSGEKSRRGGEAKAGLHAFQQAQAGILSSESPSPPSLPHPLPQPRFSPLSPLGSQNDFCSSLSLLSQLPAPALPPSASHPDSAGRNVNRLRIASHPARHHHPCCTMEMLPQLWGLPCGTLGTHPDRAWVTLTFPLGAMASRAGNHQREGKEELQEGTEKPM